MQITRTGDLARGMRCVNPARWKSYLLKHLKTETKNAATRLRDQIKEDITSGLVRPENRQATKDKKGHGIVMKESGTLVDDITIKMIPGGEGYFAGLPSSSAHFEIGVYHEIRAKVLPIRKFIEPAALKIQPELTDEFESAFERVFTEVTA